MRFIGLAKKSLRFLLKYLLSKNDMDAQIFLHDILSIIFNHFLPPFR